MCNEWWGPFLRLSAWATQLRRNVAAVGSRWRHCADRYRESNDDLICLMVCQNSCKYLNVYLDSKLPFQPHINRIDIKVAKAVDILSKLQFFFPKSTLIFLYYALIHSHVLYALPLGESTFSTYLTKSQRLQNKALRVIFNCKQLNSTTPLFHKLRNV